MPTAPNFFSIERKGYLKISDLFVDVLKDLVEHGFTLVWSSHGYNPMQYWKANVISGGSNIALGNVMYITDGTRPSYQGSQRPAPWVVVTSTANTTSATRTVTGLSDVRSHYALPIWQTPPSNPVTLKWFNPVTNAYVSSPVTANLDIQTTVTSSAFNSGISTIQTVENAPQYYSFVVEASGIVDPWNSNVHPTAVPTRAIEEYEKQPWRIQFTITDEQAVGGYVATPLQMSFDDATGNVSVSKVNDDDGTVIDNVGAFGSAQIGGTYSDSDLGQAFYNRTIRVKGATQTFPLSYILSITDRGFFLGIYEGSWSTTRAATTARSNYFNWVLVQRPVNRNTGVTLVKGKAPVFALNSVNYKYYKMVVREADILHPSVGPTLANGTGNIYIQTSATTSTNGKNWKAKLVAEASTGIVADAYVDTPVGTTIYSDNKGTYVGEVKEIINSVEFYFKEQPRIALGNNDPVNGANYYITPPNQQYLRVLADAHSPDNHAIFNSQKQVSLTEDKTYLLSFPHNLTTARYRYTEELDMIGTTSADVVMAGQDIQFNTYGEPGPRTYRALPPGGEYNTGLRLAVLWAPQGPVWTAPGTEVVNNNLGNIWAGNVVSTILQADPARSGWTTPNFEIYRGNLPAGLDLAYNPAATAGNQWSISGTVSTTSFTTDTVIRFTISAKNVEDSGYALREFFYTYKPL